MGRCTLQDICDYGSSHNPPICWRLRREQERRRKLTCDCGHTHSLELKHFCGSIFTEVPGTSNQPAKYWRVGCSRPAGHAGRHRACDTEECGLWEWD